MNRKGYKIGSLMSFAFKYIIVGIMVIELKQHGVNA